MEESLTIHELDLLLKTMGEDRKEEQIFLAGLKGIDLTKHFPDPIAEKRKEMERQAAEQMGRAREYEANEFAGIGIELITD